MGAVAAQPAGASAATVSSALKQATGYTASQLQARPACGVAQPGQIRCLAQVLTVKRTGHTAPLLQAPHVRSTSPAISASAAPGQYTAAYLNWAYDTSWLSAYNGASDTVAIVDAYGDPSAYNDMEQFRTANGLPLQSTCGSVVTTSCFELVNQSGQTSPLPTNANDETGSWNIEESLDIDAVSTICPLCKILVVETNSDDSGGSPDLETGVATAARLGANQISLSWGADQPANAANNASPYRFITTAAILAASGDDSYPGPDVGYPAALADVTAIGGTSLSSSASALRGFSETAWQKQTCSGGTVCGTESGCDTTQSIPSFQSGVTTNCSGRAYNDISADGDPNTGLEIYDSQHGGEGCGTANNWCIVGGTSLATPLTAAFEAIAGITDLTPAWTYSDASLLNDVTSGSNGTCPSGQTVICTAGPGWDGPTGNGSINGDLATGGPGVGGVSAAVTTTGASLTGGVYPNGLSTTFSWSYGTTSPYTHPATTGTIATNTGLQQASGSLTGLQPCSTYHYALSASNSDGSFTGYDTTLTTAAQIPPANSALPTISGTASVGGNLSTTTGSWSESNCSTTTYQWQESSTATGTFSNISGATSSTYAPTSSDAGMYLRVAVTETDAAGAKTVDSTAVGPVPIPPVATITTSSPTTTTTSPPTTTTTSPPTPVTTTTAVVRFYRCAHTCVLINTRGARTYRPTKADYGKYLKVVTTTTRTTGTIKTASVTTRWVGPVTSSTAGAVSVSGSAHVASVSSVRSSKRKLLAKVRIAKRTAKMLTLVVTRQGRTPAQAWVYVVKKGAVVSCTPAHALRGSVTFRIALKAGQTLKLVAVQT